MLALADFFDSLLHGVLLASLALTLGGVGWGLWGLRAWQAQAPRVLVRRCLAFLVFGALALALCQVAILTLRARVLSDSLGTGMIGDFLGTAHFVAGAARALLALGMAGTAGWLSRRPGRSCGWVALTILAALLAASGGWLTHAWARLQDRSSLMTLTVFHQLGAMVWAGALIQLGSIWPLARRDCLVESVWPVLVRRFSQLAAVSVLVLVVAALPLTWIYAGSLGSLLGTGFGSLVLTKCLLLGAALLLAAFNFAAARGPDRRPGAPWLRTRLPYLVEAEGILVVVIVFTAAALSAQPPAADLPVADRATVGEVAQVFRPKLPSLRTPSLEAIRHDRARPTGGERSREAYLWSNFSHNVAGLILLPMSLVALAGSVREAGWERHWPLGFLAMAAFVYLRAAANNGVWPFGGTPLAALNAEAMQHFLAVLLVLALGFFEWRARSAGRRWRYVFPTLGMVGGILLVTHSHTAFEPKPAFLVQVTHTTIGALAGLTAAARWLELRLPPPAGRVAGAVAGSAMVAIALVLVFYREANVVIPE